MDSLEIGHCWKERYVKLKDHDANGSEIAIHMEQYRWAVDLKPKDELALLEWLQAKYPMGRNTL